MVFTRVRAFPGEKSPGLIEASCSTGHSRGQGPTFPGEKSPGLIEAPFFRQESQGFDVSGGEIPRPH